MPRDFGWRYIGWLVWSNAVTILASVQAVVGVLAITTGVFPDGVSHWLQIANAVLTVIVAQIKRNNPPGPPPTKGV